MLKDCEPLELEKMIEDNPLTTKAVAEIMVAKIGTIAATDAFARNSIFYNKKTGKYDLYFSKEEIKKGLETCAKSLGHKIYHVHLGVSAIMNNEPTVQKSMKIEIIIDNATDKFYNKNKEFLENLYKNISSKYLNMVKTA